MQGRAVKGKWERAKCLFTSLRARQRPCMQSLPRTLQQGREGVWLIKALEDSFLESARLQRPAAARKRQQLGREATPPTLRGAVTGLVTRAAAPGAMILNTLDRFLIRREQPVQQALQASREGDQAASGVEQQAGGPPDRTAPAEEPAAAAGPGSQRPAAGTLDGFLVRRDATAEASTSGRAGGEELQWQALPRCGATVQA